MSKKDQLAGALSLLNDPRLTDVLVPLHVSASRDERRLVRRLVPYLPKLLLRRRLNWEKVSPKLEDLYLAVDPANGLLCYQLLRALRARRVVELGTSMGISTIYLAAAVRDNGGGTVIATEIVPEKAARARENLERSGLLDLVDVRVGDAMETLVAVTGPIDFVLNDIHPPVALPIMKRLAPELRPGLQLPMRFAGEFSVKTGPPAECA